VASANRGPLSDAAEPFPAGIPGQAMDEIRRALATRGQMIDSGELARNLLDVWGGPRRLAEDIFREFTKAQNGSVARQRNLEMVMRLIVTNTTHDIIRPVNPEDLSDDELAGVAAHYLERAGKASSSSPTTTVTPFHAPDAPGPGPDEGGGGMDTGASDGARGPAQGPRGPGGGAEAAALFSDFDADDA
jgi:hypothetical protein